MSTPGWTPGPWQAVQTEREHFLIEQCPCATNVAKTYGGIPRREEKANADLLAAAPDLYEALERVTQWMDDNGYSPEDASFGARAALAKARGESQ